MERAEKQENFFKLVLIIVDIIPKHLRNLFKDSWLQNYGQPWGDNRQAGDKMKREIAKFGGTYPNPDVEQNVTNGETEKWDCSTLFFALIFSKLDLLSGESRIRINNIRAVRNQCFAHSSKAEIPSDIFAQLVEDLAKIFRYFGWDEKEITSIPRIPLTTTDLILKKAEIMIEKKYDDMLKAVSLVADSARAETNKRFSSVESKVEDLKKEVQEVKSCFKHSNGSSMLAVFAVIIEFFSTVFLSILHACHKVYCLEPKRDRFSNFVNFIHKEGIQYGFHSDTLQRTYQRTLRNWTIPFINKDKEIRVVEKPRANFMVKLALADSRNLDQELKYANEVQDYIEKLSQSGPIEIKNVLDEVIGCCFIRGVAGVGKTSLVEYITLSWAEDELFRDRFDAVFLIKCRYIDSFRVETINADFKRQFGVDPDMLRESGERVLIIIDGLDEVADLDKMLSKDSIIHVLMSKNSWFIPGHVTLVTGRPHIEAVLRQHEYDITGQLRTIEVVGLVRETIELFVSNFCDGDLALKTRILEFIDSSPCIAGLATIPQYLNSLCCVLAIEKEGIKIEKSTSLYIWIFVSFLRHHMKEFNKFPYEILEDEDVKRFLSVMSKISYELLIQNRIVFNVGDFADFDNIISTDTKVREMLESFVIKKKCSTGLSYQYRHLTLHEFLASIHCFKHNIDTNFLLDKQLFQVVTFVAGFVSTDKSNTKGTIDSLFARCLDRSHTGVQSAGEILEQVIERYRSDNETYSRVFLTVFRELYDTCDQISLDLNLSGCLLYLNPLTSHSSMLLTHMMDVIINNDCQKAMGDLKIFLYSTVLEDSKLNRKLFEKLPYFQTVGFKACSIPTCLFEALNSSMLLHRSVLNLRELVFYKCELSEEHWNCLAPSLSLVEKFTLWEDEFDQKRCQVVVESFSSSFSLGRCTTKELRLFDCNIGMDVKRALIDLQSFIEVKFSKSTQNQDVKKAQDVKLTDFNDVKWKETSIRKLKFRSSTSLAELLKDEKAGGKCWVELAETLHFTKDEIEKFRNDGEPVLLMLNAYAKKPAASIPALLDAFVILGRLDCCLVLQTYIVSMEAN
ncbi:NACHT, LRR and PYD domains-containing protein 14-like isoform X2 [Rhopilema esculentum]|uniref:NACHT, LRR and PYD domains-containing protein 14-like isoform X2 n=1 Tax=Rhopilema esculentum TaxID=499914 RepID=UPI0031D6534C